MSHRFPAPPSGPAPPSASQRPGGLQRRRSSVTLLPLSSSHQQPSSFSQHDHDLPDRANSPEGENDSQQQHQPGETGEENSAASSLLSPTSPAPSSDQFSPDEGVMRELYMRYNGNDIQQCKELYDTLLEMGALKASWNGMPNAFELLGTAEEIFGRHGVVNTIAGRAGGGPASPKGGALRSLIRKHGIGQNRMAQSLQQFQLMVKMLCVPIKERRHGGGGGRRRSMIGGGVGVGAGQRGADNSALNPSASMVFENKNFQYDSQVEQAGVGSRASSPDLFGDLRSSSPSTPSPAFQLQGGDSAFDDDEEHSPERLLEKLESIADTQSERSKRAKGVIRLSRKELLSVCEVEDVGAFSAGYDLHAVRTRDRRNMHGHRRRVVDPETRREHAKFRAEIAVPWDIRPPRFHGAAARSIGSYEPAPQFYNSRTSGGDGGGGGGGSPPSSAPATARATSTIGANTRMPALGPATARSPGIGRVGAGGGASSSAAAAPVATFKHRARSPISDTYTGMTSDSSDDDFSDTYDSRSSHSSRYRAAGGDRHHHGRRRSSSGKHGGGGGGDAPSKVSAVPRAGRHNIRSHGMTLQVDKPERFMQKQAVIPHLSARVKFRDAQRRTEEKNELGGFATSKTLARRLRNIEAGKGDAMLNIDENDEDAKLLSMWVRN